VRALSSRPGVFHVVTRTSRIEAGGSRTRTWTETWASASGERRRSLVYDVRADGRRGRLVAERVGGTTVPWASPRDGGPIADGGDAAVRPQSYVLVLLRSGRVTRQVQVTFAGRKAWPVEIRPPTQTTIQTEGRRVPVPPSTRRSTLIVDGRTHLPLLLHTNGVVPTIGRSRVTFPRVSTTARFSAFERLTDAAGAAGLRPSARFRHR